MARSTIGVGGVSVLFVLACGSSDPEVAEPAGGQPDVEAAEAPAPAAEPEAKPAGATFVLTGVTSGDASCYVQLVDDGGAERSMHADFELCPGGGHDATALVGSRVALTTRQDKVIADSCNGDPECTDTQAVELVTALTVQAPAGGADGAPETCPTAALEQALAESDVAGAVSSRRLGQVRCNDGWATAHTVVGGDEDSAVVLFTRSAKGTWVAVNAGTGGVCDEVPEADRAGLDCD